MHTDRNTIVHIPVIQYNDEPATSTSSQQWECQTGCNVTKVKIELKFDHYVIRMLKHFIILMTSNLKSSVG